jgi:ATP-binding cassette subfamily B protein
MPGPLYSNWTLLVRLLRLAKQYRWGCLRLVVVQLLVLGLGLTSLTLVGLSIDTIAFHAAAKGVPPRGPLGIVPPAGRTPLATIAILATVVLAIAIVRGALNYWYAVASARLLQEQIVVELRAKVYAQLQRLSFRFFSSNPSGSLINRVTGDVQAVRLFIDGVILQMVILVLSLAVYLAYMLSIDVGLTLLCLATTPVLWALSISFSRTVRPAYNRNRDLFDHLLLTLTENVRGVHVVKGFVRQPQETAKFRAANRAVRDQQRWIFWRVSLFTPSAEFLMSLNLVILLGYGGYLVLQNRVPIGAGLIVFSGLLQQFASQVSKMTNIVNSIQQSLAGADRVFEILDTPIEVHSPPRAQRLGRSKGEIAFRHVSFHYRPGQSVLEEVDFRVQAGQQVAILGATGEGKTTLLNLIPRFYDPICGRVTLDGVDLRQLDLDGLRRNIGIVFQENFLFSDTVAANIAFGRPGASMEQVQRAAKIAAAHGFITTLPEGYQTILHEGGKDLSGGQRQRLAIARALLLEPPILLLDDPTAAIDQNTEEEILTAMEQAMTGRTTFFVAHRISTLRRADLVIVLRGGRIVEMGRHDQLMALRGAYWQAARLQLSDAAPPTQRVA